MQSGYRRFLHFVKSNQCQTDQPNPRPGRVCCSVPLTSVGITDDIIVSLTLMQTPTVNHLLYYRLTGSVGPPLLSVRVLCDVANRAMTSLIIDWMDVLLLHDRLGRTGVCW